MGPLPGGSSFSMRTRGRTQRPGEPSGRRPRVGGGAAAGWFRFPRADRRLDAAAWEAIRKTIAVGRTTRAASFRLRLDDGAWQARLLGVGGRRRGAGPG